MEAGTNLLTPNVTGQTPLDLAIAHNQKEVVKLLLPHVIRQQVNESPDQSTNRSLANAVQFRNSSSSLHRQSTNLNNSKVVIGGRSQRSPWDKARRRPISLALTGRGEGGRENERPPTNSPDESESIYMNMRFSPDDSTLMG